MPAISQYLVFCRSALNAARYAAFSPVARCSVVNNKHNGRIDQEGKMTQSAKVQRLREGVCEIPMQSASEDIWDKKYRLKTKDG